MRFGSLFAFIATSIALVLVAPDNAAAQTRALPYYASISAGSARMRTGPGRDYPTTWEYRRADLPIKVIEIYQDWRKIEDPDGTQGWMLATLLSARRTAIVMGSNAEMREKASFDSTVSWRAAPGVVGQISNCAGGWCWFDVHGKAGYIEETHVWGVDPGEQVD